MGGQILGRTQMAKRGQAGKPWGPDIPHSGELMGSGMETVRQDFRTPRWGVSERQEGRFLVLHRVTRTQGQESLRS